jgi:polar amino acid transport system substrate-binding protein
VKLRNASARISAWVAVVAAASLFAAAAHGRTLEEVKARGTIALCANPNALPYGREKPAQPGFQMMLSDGTVTQIYAKYGVEHRLP